MRKKGLSFGTNIKGGPIPKLDIIALEKLREDLVAKKEATGFWPTTVEFNHGVTNGARNSQMRKDKTGIQTDLPTTTSKYINEKARDILDLTQRKPQHLTDARKKGTSDPESTIIWAFLLMAFASNLRAWQKSNCDGSTLTIRPDGDGVKVVVTKEAVARNRVLQPSDKRHMGRRKTAPVSSNVGDGLSMSIKSMGFCGLSYCVLFDSSLNVSYASFSSLNLFAFPPGLSG